MLEGFPKAASEAKTILEYAMVLKDTGHLLIRVPSVMMEENKPRFGNFAEFALKQFYDASDQDKVVSVARVRSALSECFGKIKESEFRGNLIMYAGERKSASEIGALQEPSEKEARSSLGAFETQSICKRMPTPGSTSCRNDIVRFQHQDDRPAWRSCAVHRSLRNHQALSG